jgi:hypothetical protein
LVPLRSLARTYQQKAKDVAAGLHDPVISARVAGRAAIYRLGIGDWTACADLETAMARCDEIGDSYVWEENAAIRARAAQLRGEFELAGALGAEVRRRSATNASVPHEIWGIGGEVWANLYLDRPQIAIGLADAGLRLLSASTSSDRLATLDFLGAKALAHLRRDQLAQSHQAAEQIIESLANSPSPGYFSLLGISAAVEVCLTVWEAEGTSPRGGEAETQVRHLCRHLDRYARVSPPARARALLWRGRAEWLRGQCDRAQATWRDCLVESERFALPYEAGYTHFEIGRHLGRTNPERRSHLVSAQEQFRQLRADFDLRRVDAALRES